MNPFTLIPVVLAANKDKLGGGAPMGKKAIRQIIIAATVFVVVIAAAITTAVHFENKHKSAILQDWTAFSQRNHEVTILDISSAKVPSSRFSDYEHVVTVKGVGTGEIRIIHDRSDPVFIYPTPGIGQTWTTRVEKRKDGGLYDFTFKMDLVNK